jgi:hypothetical protein
MRTYDEIQKSLTEEEEKLRRSQQNLNGLRDVFSALPTLLNNQANVGLLEEACAPEPVTLQRVLWMIQNSDLASSLSKQSEAEARERFVDEIVALAKGDAQSKAHLRAQLLAKWGQGFNVKTTQELQQKMNETKKEVVLRGSSREELRKLVRDSQDPDLVGKTLADENTMRISPKHIFIEGRYYPMVPPDITPERIRKIGTSGGESTAVLRKWNATYHSSQITARLRGQS